MTNMNCSSQKANSDDFNDNYPKIFKDMQSVEEIREQHKCKLCEKDGGVVCSKAEWEELWSSICDNCAHKLMREESDNAKPYRL